MQTKIPNPGGPNRIAILYADGHKPGSRHHMICVLADFWRGDGIEVFDLAGTDKFVPADLLIVHVDRSIVPQAYADFARRYPMALNASALDIRKRTYADGLLDRGSNYNGPVIVKSDLNYGGAPERNHTPKHQARLQNAIQKFNRRLSPEKLSPIGRKEDYRLYLDFSQVPPEAFRKENIVQKFLPEWNDGRFVLREYYFLCDRHYLSIETSEAPIFTDDRLLEIKPWSPLPQLLAVRKKLGLEYGKIDFVMVNDAPFIFDANKTMGLGSIAECPTIDEQYATMHGDYIQMTAGLAAGLLDWYQEKAGTAC